MGGKEREYNRDIQSSEIGNKRRSGELAEGEEEKLPSGYAQKETSTNEKQAKREPTQTKPLFLEALVRMNVQSVENQILRQQVDEQQKADKEQAVKKARRIPKYDLSAPVESQTDDPPNLPDNFKPELSPLLEMISKGMLVPIHVMAEIYANENKDLAEYIAQRAREVKDRHFLEEKNRVLLEEKQQLRAENKELAEKVERHLQQARDSYTRQRQENLEEYREKRREYMREYRARKKLEAESQEPPEEEDDSSQSS